jgi:hypothetical protein
VLLVAEGFDHLIDRGIEGIAHWRRQDRDAPRAQAPASGCTEVRRRRVARQLQQPLLPLVQRTPAEAVVRHAVAVAHHCLRRFRGEKTWEKVNAARCGRSTINRVAH